MTGQQKKGVLDGIRVVEWAGYHIGPAAAAMLGDLGAEVIKIEPPGKGDPMRSLVLLYGIPTVVEGRQSLSEDLNRNKKSITIDVHKAKGKQIVYSLIEKSDIFLTNFLAERAKRMGLDYETLHAKNPNLIYVSASAYGAKGSDAWVTGVETNLYARSGLMLSCGEPDSPPVNLVPGIADRSAGVFLAYAALAALLARERHGITQEGHTSGLGALITLQTPAIQVTSLTGQKWPRVPTREFKQPTYALYECKDGRWLAFGALPDDLYWKPFCEVLGLPEIVDKPEFIDSEHRASNIKILRPILEKAFATRTAQEWEPHFNKRRLRCSIVQTIEEVTADPQALANEHIIDYDHPALGHKVRIVGFPIQLYQTPLKIRNCAPEVGQDTEEILTRMCGYNWDEVAQLREEGVI